MFQSVLELISTPILWKVIIAYWIFNAAVTSLPQPNGSKLYQFVYRFCHALAGNIDRAAQKFNVPGAPPDPPIQP